MKSTKHGQPHSPAFIAAVAEDYKRDMPYKAICAKHGLTFSAASSIISRLLRAGKVAHRPKPPPPQGLMAGRVAFWTEEKKAILRQLASDGLSAREIGVRMNRSPMAIQAAARRLGVAYGRPDRAFEKSVRPAANYEAVYAGREYDSIEEDPVTPRYLLLPDYNRTLTGRQMG